MVPAERFDLCHKGLNVYALPSYALIGETPVGTHASKWSEPELFLLGACNIVVETDPCVTYDKGQSVTLPSKAYDFYLHLREGYIVPMQDAKALKAMTSADLQDEPVDFHVSPIANGTHFSAMGRYLNDDGLVLNVTGNQNVYAITYESAKTDIGSTLFFERSANASSMVDDEVNGNDSLGMLKFHNAKATMNGQNMKVAKILASDPSKPVALLFFDLMQSA